MDEFKKGFSSHDMQIIVDKRFIYFFLTFSFLTKKKFFFTRKQIYIFFVK
jgi:hypothetical protein